MRISAQVAETGECLHLVGFEVVLAGATLLSVAQVLTTAAEAVVVGQASALAIALVYVSVSVFAVEVAAIAVEAEANRTAEALELGAVTGAEEAVESQVELPECEGTRRELLPVMAMMRPIGLLRLMRVWAAGMGVRRVMKMSPQPATEPLA